MGNVPDGEGLELGVTGLHAALVLVVQLGKAGGHFSAAGAGGRDDHQRALGLDVIVPAILPAVVQLAIMLVNGNLGAGVAVAGAFGLVRFRSAPGTAKEIGALFLAMAIGLATGMGYVWLAVMVFAIVSAVMLLLTAVNFGGADEHERQGIITHGA